MARISASELTAVAEDCGLHIRTWAPGDGLTRYRFFTDGANSYFGPKDGIFTALGAKEALVFLRGYQRGRQNAPVPA